MTTEGAREEEPSGRGGEMGMEVRCHVVWVSAREELRMEAGFAWREVRLAGQERCREWPGRWRESVGNGWVGAESMNWMLLEERRAAKCGCASAGTLRSTPPGGEERIELMGRCCVPRSLVSRRPVADISPRSDDDDGGGRAGRGLLIATLDGVETMSDEKESVREEVWTKLGRRKRGSCSESEFDSSPQVLLLPSVLSNTGEVTRRVAGFFPLRLKTMVCSGCSVSVILWSRILLKKLSGAGGMGSEEVDGCEASRRRWSRDCEDTLRTMGRWGWGGHCVAPWCEVRMQTVLVVDEVRTRFKGAGCFVGEADILLVTGALASTVATERTLADRVLAGRRDSSPELMFCTAELWLLRTVGARRDGGCSGRDGIWRAITSSITRCGSSRNRDGFRPELMIRSNSLCSGTRELSRDTLGGEAGRRVMALKPSSVMGGYDPSRRSLRGVGRDDRLERERFLLGFLAGVPSARKLGERVDLGVDDFLDFPGSLTLSAMTSLTRRRVAVEAVGEGGIGVVSEGGVGEAGAGAGSVAFAVVGDTESGTGMVTRLAV